MKLDRSWLLEEFEELLKLKNTDRVIKLNKKLDDFFFGNLEKAHNTINHKHVELYSDIELEAFSTPYIDYFQILSDIPFGTTLVDLGGGYGRGCFLSDFLSLPRCISLEKSKPRTKFSQEKMEVHSYSKSKHINADLVDYKLPKERAYYLYFPRCQALDQILINLSGMHGSFLYVCESHGDLLDYLDRLCFLNKVGELELSIPRHIEKMYKYQINSIEKSNISVEEFPTWILFNKDNDLVLEVLENHLLLREDVTWLIHISDTEYIFYNGKVSLLQLSTGKIYDVDLKIKIEDISNNSNYSKILINRIRNNERVFALNNENYIDKSGRLIKLKPTE
jgi:hypothetical protein